MDEHAPDDPLDQILIGGREQRDIVIVAYDSAWPQRYELERTRIQTALGHVALLIEHIGSTAVPGLAAKPIIDIIVGVREVDDDARYVPALEAAGYVLRVREPEHRMLRTPALDVHVHVWEAGGGHMRRHVVFRDWLRVSAEDRQAYERLKRQLARRRWRDMNDYAQAKGPMIAEIMQRAEAWPAHQAELLGPLFASAARTNSVLPRV